MWLPLAPVHTVPRGRAKLDAASVLVPVKSAEIPHHGQMIGGNVPAKSGVIVADRDVFGNGETLVPLVCDDEEGETGLNLQLLEQLSGLREQFQRTDASGFSTNMI